MADVTMPAVSEATRPMHPRVVFVFDFDRTLAERTTDRLLRHLGVDPEAFTRQVVEPRLDDGWDERLAEAWGLVELSRSERGPITAQTFAEVAATLELYPGVTSLFERLRTEVHGVDPGLDVEFHLLTAGFVEVPAATSIAEHFDTIVGCRWSFDESGAIAWPARLVGHYDKVRHLLALAKGLDSVEADRPNDIDRTIAAEQWHVPFEQLIYVGDGDSDLPAFDFMRSHSGLAIGVYEGASPRSWKARPNMRRGRRVATLLPADYTDSSSLSRALGVAARRAARWTQLLSTAPAAS